MKTTSDFHKGDLAKLQQLKLHASTDLEAFVDECSSCGGAGSLESDCFEPMGQGHYTASEPCEACHGTGKSQAYINAREREGGDDECSKCGGQGNV
jgi:DnaJ-class molecular chaperone